MSQPPAPRQVVSVSDTLIERGRLSYRSAHEQSDRTELALHDDTSVSFGRSEGCEVRIGHAPVRDIQVPRVAGWLLMSHGRVIVEAAPDPVPSEVPTNFGGRTLPARRALQVRSEGGPPVPIAPGAAYSPATRKFTVEVYGATGHWELDVVMRREPTAHATGTSGQTADEPSTYGVVVDLDEVQRRVLLAYAEPVLAGGIEPATHDQVASKLFMSRSAVRRVLDRVSDEFYDKRLWAPAASDTRVRVVEAARHNRLLQLAVAAG